jgi:hypothetical protein
MIKNRVYISGKKLKSDLFSLKWAFLICSQINCFNLFQAFPAAITAKSTVLTFWS